MSITATERLETLGDALREINAIRGRLADEADQIIEEWEGLGAANGQRDDHAACLLERMLPHFRALSDFCGACGLQIESAMAHPFGR